MEKYSVLMSVYEKDSPEYLSQAIKSMLDQTVPCEQFVLVEDGPLSFGLMKVIEKHVSENPAVFTVVKLETNRGLGKALDAGLEQCRNDLVARMDADDISKPERCEKLLRLFQKHKNLSLAGGNIDEFNGSPQNVFAVRTVPDEYDRICKFMRRRSPFNHVSVMFRKSEVIRCGGYGKMRRKQDFDLFARMLNDKCYALNINESLVWVRADESYYERRGSWEYCKSYIDAEVMNYKRGFCSLLDLAVVAAGQMIFYLAPRPAMKFLSDHLLRNKKSA